VPLNLHGKKENEVEVKEEHRTRLTNFNSKDMLSSSRKEII
jgi:hypothetical protein